MNDRTITKEDKRLVSLFQTIDQLLEVIENIIGTSKPGLGSEQYLTDRDLSKLLTHIAATHP